MVAQIAGQELSFIAQNAESSLFFRFETPLRRAFSASVRVSAGNMT